jgi:hypothetical protein
LHILTTVEAGLFPKTVMVLLWVLDSVYSLPGEEIAHSIESLIQADTLSTKPSLCVIFNPIRLGSTTSARDSTAWTCGFQCPLQHFCQVESLATSPLNDLFTATESIRNNQRIRLRLPHCRQQHSFANRL